MCRGPPPAGRMPFMSDSTLIRRSAALRGLKPLTKLPTGNGENVRKFQICLARLSALIEAAKSGPALSESREIIVLKAQIVEKAFRDLNLRLEKSRRTTRVYFDSRAYAAGQLAGEKVSITSGAIDDDRQTRSS